MRRYAALISGATQIVFAWVVTHSVVIAGWDSVIAQPEWLRWVWTGVFCIGALVIVLRLHLLEFGPVQTLVYALTAWAVAPAIAVVASSDDGYTTGQWYSSAWYWALDPLPVDVSGPTGWAPPVVKPDAVAATLYVLLQAMTILVALFAIGLVVAHYRSRSLLRSQGD